MRALGLVFCALASAVPSALTQTLPAGTWTGTLKVGGRLLAVEYTVSDDDSLHVMMGTVNGPRFPVTDIQLTEQGLRFRWEAFSCTLTQRKEKYQGTCQNEDASRGDLTLTPPPRSGPPAMHRTSEIVTGAELRQTQATNLYAALQRLRPQWFNVRRVPFKEPNPLEVRVGTQPMGTIEYLRSRDLLTVKEVRFYPGREAIVLFGPTKDGGVMVITEG